MESQSRRQENQTLQQGAARNDEPLAGGLLSISNGFEQITSAFWNHEQVIIQDGHEWNTNAEYLRIPFDIFQRSG